MTELATNSSTQRGKGSGARPSRGPKRASCAARGLEYVGGRGNLVREYAEDDGLGVAAPGALGELVADVGGGFGDGFGAADA